MTAKELYQTYSVLHHYDDFGAYRVPIYLTVQGFQTLEPEYMLKREAQRVISSCGGVARPKD